MSTGVSFTLEQDGQKSGGAMPPSLKSGGVTGPLGSAAYVILTNVFSSTFINQSIDILPEFWCFYQSCECEHHFTPVFTTEHTIRNNNVI